MARFVLVHGAFGGGWIWGPLAERLEAAGHKVEAPDLPGAGDDETPLEEVTLERYAERICEVLDAEPRAGRSWSATAWAAWSITQAAARRPEPVSVADLRGRVHARGRTEPGRADRAARGSRRSRPGDCRRLGRPPGRGGARGDQRASNEYCTPELSEWAVAKAGRQPIIPFTEPVSLSDEFERIPRSYVITTKDRFIPPPLQRRMVKDRNVTDVIELGTDHHPQLSRTEELAGLLDERSRDQVAA